MPSRSERRSRRRVLVIAAGVAVVLTAPVAALATVIGTDIYLLGPDQVVGEDLVLSARSASVEGTVDGDLTVAAGSLLLSGEVTGDVTVLSHGEVTVTGTVGGSVRGTGRQVTIAGRVADDVIVAAVTLAVPGDVGRDLVAWAWRLEVGGSVGRDVLGRYSSAEVAGSVGNDVDVAVSSLTVSGDVGGDLVYRSNRPAELAGATVAGQVVDIPVRAPFMVTAVLYATALLGLFGYLVGGIVLLWLFEATAAGALGAVGAKGWRCIATGVATVVALALVVGALAVTLVGIPLALLSLLALVGALCFGSVPVVAAAGMHLTGGGAGPLGGLVVGAVALALLAALVPALGALVYLVALVWGVGAWVLGGWTVRARRLDAVSTPGTAR